MSRPLLDTFADLFIRSFLTIRVTTLLKLAHNGGRILVRTAMAQTKIGCNFIHALNVLLMNGIIEL